MSFLVFLWLAVALGAGSVFPGALIAGRWGWRSTEGICVSVAISHVVLYLLGTAVYLWDLPLLLLQGYTVATVILAACVCKPMARIVSRETGWNVLLPQLVVILWGLTLECVVRVYSGMFWFGDWYEHYERACFFLETPDSSRLFFNDITLPARPPFMNLLQAHFLAVGGETFADFQFVTVVLNTLVFLPCCLLVEICFPNQRRANWIFAILLMANPLFVQNVTFTWTKLYTAFYVILGISLYVEAWRTNSQGRMVLAFGALACGILVHYSTGPYAVFLAAHYLLVLFRRRPQRSRELGWICAVSTLLLLTWFGWSIATYGIKVTLASNTSVQGFSQAAPKDYGRKILLNVVDSVVPFFLRGEPVPADRNTSGMAWFRDATFGAYQVNLIFALGSVGWLATLYGLGSGMRTLTRDRMFFWIALVVCCGVLGLAVHGETDPYGVAHICLQPLILMGLVLQAGAFARLPRWLSGLVVLGLVVDIAVGIDLHVLLESYDIPLRPVRDGLYSLTNRCTLGDTASSNAILKRKHSLTFLGDECQSFALLVQGLFLLGGLALPIALVRLRQWRSGR